MDFFVEAWSALQESSPDNKIKMVLSLWDRFLAGEFEDFSEKSEILIQSSPSYAAICDIVRPADVLKRRNLDSVEGKKVFIHALTHIEYAAIDLALDACYSFRGLPSDFYRDWLEVAKEECEHFSALRDILRSFGGEYGDYPVHISLFDALRRSDTLLKRMAAIPRYLEAGGLDANKKLSAKADKISPALVDALKIILRDEISHVHKGDKWFKYACKEAGCEPSVYFEIIDETLPGGLKPKVEMNIEDRLKAGFACHELKRLGGNEVEC